MFLQEEACTGFASSLPTREGELDALKESATASIDDILMTNWDLATNAGDTDLDLLPYGEE